MYTHTLHQDICNATSLFGHVLPKALSMAHLISLGQDNPNVVQHDILIMWTPLAFVLASHDT